MRILEGTSVSFHDGPEGRDGLLPLHRLVDMVVSDNYQYGKHETPEMCGALLLPHVNAVLELEGTGPGNERSWQGRRSSIVLQVWGATRLEGAV